MLRKTRFINDLNIESRDVIYGREVNIFLKTFFIR